jgi:hypothetical protein
MYKMKKTTKENIKIWGLVILFIILNIIVFTHK